MQLSARLHCRTAEGPAGQRKHRVLDSVHAENYSRRDESLNDCFCLCALGIEVTSTVTFFFYLWTPFNAVVNMCK